MNINIVSILEKHLPFIPADLNQRKMKVNPNLVYEISYGTKYSDV